MKINRRKVLTLVSMLSISSLLSCGGKDNFSDVIIALPPVLRSDLNYVYYLSTPGQTEKVKDHTNLVWHAQFYDNNLLEQELKGNNFDLVLDCAMQLFKRTDNSVSMTAREDLHLYFTDLSNRGLLQRVKYLTPMDEPNFFVKSEEDLRAALQILKEEAKKWTVLSDVKYICIYGSNNNFMALEEFDIVGIDDYPQKSEVLTVGSHAELMRALLPHQQVMVIPGAAYGQDPAAFVAYAHSTPQVWGVVPFIWAHVPASADKEGWVGLENQSEEAKEVYRNAGLLTLNKLKK